MIIVDISVVPFVLSPDKAQPMIPEEVSVGMFVVPIEPGVPLRATNSCALLSGVDLYVPSEFVRSSILKISPTGPTM